MNKYIKKIISILIVVGLFGTLIYLNIEGNKESEEKEKLNKYIEMDAVVSYSCSDYSVFSTAEFSSFVVFGEPIRDYYDTVILTIDTKNTSNTADDEVVKVKNRDPKDINSSGGDIYDN